jgi:hypothetical protein
MTEYNAAAPLRPGDEWIDTGGRHASGAPSRDWRLRVVEVEAHAVPTIVKVIGEDVATGERYPFEFYRSNNVQLAEG